MSKKAIYTLVIIVIILALGYFFYARNKAQAPSTDLNGSSGYNSDATTEQNPSGQAHTIQNANGTDYQPSQTPTPSAGPAGTHFSGEGDIEGNDIMVYEVDYDGSKLTPASQTVKVGDIVVFKNTGKGSFHPLVDVKINYPEFDSKTTIAAGDDFQFKFTKVGTWTYHDATNASAKGTIIVTK